MGQHEGPRRDLETDSVRGHLLKKIKLDGGRVSDSTVTSGRQEGGPGTVIAGPQTPFWASRFAGNWN